VAFPLSFNLKKIPILLNVLVIFRTFTTTLKRISMKKFTSSVLAMIIIASVTLSLNSCMMTKTSVGEYKQQTGEEYTYAKGKQLWLFWGIIPVGRTSVATPPDGNCEVVTKLKFGDFLISGLTGGILTSQTIKVNAKK
jgi:hypothetical protein